MTTYYIDNSAAKASDKNAGTSADDPFASLAALNKLKLQPGDTVAIRAGTVYNVNASGSAALSLTASGTASNPITITSYGNGDKPVINNVSKTAYSDGIDLLGSQYVNINGLSFGNATQAGVKINDKSSHITVQNSEMTNVGEGVQIQGTNNLVTQNYIHDLHMVKNTPTNTTNAATIAATNDDDYGAEGIVVGGSNNELSYNKIVNAKAPSYDYGVDGGGIELFGTMTNVSIHDNYVANSDGFMEAGGVNATLSNIQVSNNVSYNNGNFATIHNGGGGFAGKFTNVQIQNNTVVDQNNGSKEMGTIFLDSAATSAASVNVTNNIFSLNDGDSVFKKDTTAHSGNLFYLQSKDTHLYNDWGTSLNAGEQYANPGLNNAASGNFTPTASGLAQTVGASISAKLQAVISGTSITSSAAVSSTTSGASSVTTAGSSTGSSVPPAPGTPPTPGSGSGASAPGSSNSNPSTPVSSPGNATATSSGSGTPSSPLTTRYADGTSTVLRRNLDGSSEIDSYVANGSMSKKVVTNVDGSTVTDAFTNGHVTQHTESTKAGVQTLMQQFDANGVLTYQVKPGANGAIVQDRYTNGQITEQITINQSTAQTLDQQFSVNGVKTYTSQTAADGSVTAYKYDAAGNVSLKSIQYKNGSSAVTSYYANGTASTLVLKNADGSREADNYATDGSLTRKMATNPNGSLTTTYYGVTGQSYTTLTTLSDPAGNVTSTTRYHADGTLDYYQNLASNGTKTTNTYDATGAMTSSTAVAADGTVTEKALAAGITMVSGTKGDTFTSFHNDTIAFHAGFGNDTIKGFNAGNGSTHDVIQIDKSMVSDYAHLAISQSGSDALVTISPHDVVTLKGVNTAALTASDFKFT